MRVSKRLYKPGEIVNVDLPFVCNEPIAVGRANQTDFDRARWDSYYRGVFTSFGGGKTALGTWEVVKWCFAYPGVQGYAGEPTYKMVTRILIPAFESKLLLGCKLSRSPLVHEFNKSDNFIEWVNGSVTWLGSMEYPSANEGPNLDYIYQDEGRLIRNFDLAWLVLVSRLRGTGALPANVEPRMWWTSTPTPRNSPMWMKFADPVERDPDCIEFHWGLDDNPYLTDQFKRGVLKACVTEQEKACFCDGDWADLAMGDWDFNYKIHVIGRDGPIKMVLPPKKRMKVNYGLDWGWQHYLAFEVGIWDSRGRVQIVDEIYEQKLEDNKLIEKIKQKQEIWEMIPYQERRRRILGGPVWCGHDEPKTILLLRKAGIDAKSYPMGKNAIGKKDGVRIVGSMFKQEISGIPMIAVHPRCKGFLWEINEYNSEKNENDDAADSARYMISMGMGDVKKAMDSMQLISPKRKEHQERLRDPFNVYGARRI